MCPNLNQMLHSNVAQHEINVSVQCGAPLYCMTIFISDEYQRELHSDYKTKPQQKISQADHGRFHSFLEQETR